MLLIQNNQPQPRKRCEQRRSRSDHNIDLPALRPQALIAALALRHFGMQNGYPPAEPVIKAQHRLIGERNLRNQHYHLPSLPDDLLNHGQIDLRLPASGDPVNQVGPIVPSAPVGQHAIPYLPLLIIQLRSLFFRPSSLKQFLHRIPVTGLCLHLNQPALLHTAYGRGADRQLIRYNIPGKLPLAQQLAQQPLLRRVPALYRGGKCIPAGIGIRRKHHRLFLRRTHRPPDGKHCMQGSVHGRTKVFPYIICQLDQMALDHPAVFLHRKKRPDALRLKLRLFRQPDNIALSFPFSERNMNRRADHSLFRQTLRNGILVGLIQLSA